MGHDRVQRRRGGQVAGKSLADLLAARSLIYIKLIEKDELIPGASTAPHAEGEIRINAMVDRLSFEDCEMIFDRI